MNPFSPEEDMVVWFATRKHKRAYWGTAFPGFKNLVPVKVVPEHLDVLNYARGAQGDPVTWHAPGVDFKKNE